MEDAHTKSVEEVFLAFRTDENSGLTDDQVKQNQEKYGPNGNYTFKCYTTLNVAAFFKGA